MTKNYLVMACAALLAMVYSSFPVTAQTGDRFTDRKVAKTANFASDEYVVQLSVPTDSMVFFSNVYVFTGSIDWGDGSVETFKETRNPSHVYVSSGNYRVSARGICTGLSYRDCTGKMDAGKAALVDILYIGEKMDIFYMHGAFSGCTSLKEIRKGLFDGLGKVSDFSFAFENCTSLGHVATTLFDRCIWATDFVGMFKGCSNLSCETPFTVIKTPKGKVKVHLYERTKYLEYFAYPTFYDDCFTGCTGLVDYPSIPHGWKDSSLDVRQTMLSAQVPDDGK